MKISMLCTFYNTAPKAATGGLVPRRKRKVRSYYGTGQLRMWEVHARQEKAAVPRVARVAASTHKGRTHSSSNRSEILSNMRKKSRPQSRMDSNRHSDGKQIIQEARRTMTLASATSHAIVDTFLDRIKTYQTFQPLFAANKLYAQSPGTGTDEESPPKHNPWEVIDNLIETSTHHLLRNRADEHFFASFGRVTGETFKPRKRSHKVGFAHREELVDMQGEAIEKKNRSFMDTWKRDHPLSTDEEIQEETCFWSSAFSQQDRAARIEYLKQLHREIDALVLLSKGFDQKKEEIRVEQNEDSLVDGKGELDFQKMEEQKRAWVMFCKGENCPPGFSFPEKVTHIVSDYENTEELHDWIQNRWPHHTHRHENAAFIIQRAYRSYVAKCTTERKRYARWQLLRETHAAEEEGAKKWMIALQEDRLKQATDSENTPESRALKFFSRKILALVEKKRAIKGAETSERLEIEMYAATLIQKIVRGYMTRQRSLLHPEIQAARRQQKCNEAAYWIQGTWKRMLALRRWRQMSAAALKIQCCFRQHVSRRRCRFLRGLKRINVEDTQKMSAVHTLVSFGIRNIYQREAFYKRNNETVDLLQKVGRGYMDRAYTRNIPWQRQKESAAAIISARWNDILAVRRAKFYVGTFENRRERDNWQQIRNDAAATIQCAWQNYVGYKKYGRAARDRSVSFPEDEEAAVVIFSHAEDPPTEIKEELYEDSKEVEVADHVEEDQPRVMMENGPHTPVEDEEMSSSVDHSHHKLSKGAQFPSPESSAVL